MQDTELIRRTLIRYGTTQCKLSNRPGGLFYLLALLRLIYLLYELPNRPDGLLPSGTFTACFTSYRTGQTDFHSLTLDGSTICNQLGLGGDQGLGRRLIYMPGLICKHHSNSCFKTIGGQGPVVMRKARLTRIV